MTARSSYPTEAAALLTGRTAAVWRAPDRTRTATRCLEGGAARFKPKAVFAKSAGHGQFSVRACAAPYRRIAARSRTFRGPSASTDARGARLSRAVSALPLIRSRRQESPGRGSRRTFNDGDRGRCSPSGNIGRAQAGRAPGEMGLGRAARSDDAAPRRSRTCERPPHAPAGTADGRACRRPGSGSSGTAAEPAGRGLPVCWPRSDPRRHRDHRDGGLTRDRNHLPSATRSATRMPQAGG